jgi:hypothetical protein
MTTITRPKIHWALWAVPAGVVLAGAAVFGIRMLLPPPADLDLSRTQISEQALFVATIEPPAAISINQIHTWTIEVKLADGTALAPTDISIDGGMPQHGHGLPTVPQVTRDLGNGKYEVAGMKFNMPGWWVVNVHVATPSGADEATFNLTL